ncbi:MAG: hypothetical protein ACXW52_23690 [Candidatus Binatia bacterium]
MKQYAKQLAAVSASTSKTAIVQVGRLPSVLADQYDRIYSQDVNRDRIALAKAEQTREIEAANGT